MYISFDLFLANLPMATGSGDPSDWYIAECGTSQYTLPKRYQDLSPIGQGAFGAVM